MSVCLSYLKDRGTSISSSNQLARDLQEASDHMDAVFVSTHICKIKKKAFKLGLPACVKFVYEVFFSRCNELFNN